MSYEIGQAMALLTASAKQAAANPSMSYGMVGELQLSKSGWILLKVPNAIVHGAFAALNEPGAELPPTGPGARLDAHISVIRPEEIATIEGGAAAITERGRDFSYTLGPVRSTVPSGWKAMSKVWMIEVKSPALKKLRTSYGLTPLPNDNKFQFHITIAVRRRGVLGRNGTKKASLIHGDGLQEFFDSPPNKDGRRCPGCGKLFKEIEPYADVENCETCERFGPPKKEAAVTTKQMIATERLKVEDPTEAQAEAGNYRKGHIRLHGLDISIENGRGSTRSGTSPAGKAWSIKMEHDYGYIRTTEASDGDSVDVFIGGSPDTELVFVVNQVDPGTGKFDEVKCMLGFNTQEEAEAGYLANYEKGWKGMGTVVVLTIPQFKAWLAGDTTKPAKPLSKEGGDDGSPDTVAAPASRAGRPEAALSLDGWIEKHSEDEDRPPVIAVDLDGTILEYDGWKGEDHFGKPRVGARKALKEMQRRGNLVVINTCRGNVQAVKDVLHEHDLPYDYVNESPHQPPGTSDKIQADVYIDDRAVNAKQPWSKITKETVRRVKAGAEKQNGYQDSFYMAAIPGTPLTYDPNKGAVRNLIQQLGAVRGRGDRAIRETYAQEDLANAQDPDLRMKRFTSYLAGQRKPTVHHWFDRILQGN